MIFYFPKTFFFRCKFLGIFNNADLKEIFEENNRKIGLFHDKFSGKILVSIGLCISNNIFSRNTAKYLLSELEKDKSFYQKLVAEIFFPTCKEIILKILNQNTTNLSTQEKILQVYLSIYLDQLSTNTLDEAIKNFSEMIFQKIDVLCFNIHQKESDSQLFYGVEESPTFFAFIDAGFLESGQQKTQTTIFKKCGSITSRDLMKKMFSEILYNAISYYIKVIFDFSVLEKNY
jgi:hypothetical protein